MTVSGWRSQPPPASVVLGGPSDNTELTLRPGREIALDAIAQLQRERSLRRGASWESATQFAAKTPRIRQEGDITNHMAADLPRRPEGNVAVAAAPVGAIVVLPPDVADVGVGVTWRGAQRRQARLKALHEVTPQRRLARLGGLPRAAWTQRERRLGKASRAARRAADDALPTAPASSTVAVGVEVICGIMRLSRVGERLRLLTGGVIE